jgi:hypothetical protein
VIESLRLIISSKGWGVWWICGRRQVLGRMYMGRIVHGAANLQTTLSLNVLLKNVLLGLRIVDSAGFSPAS